MDDTHQSRVSDAAAAATRKRRSSILKSQRPTRTPFSDLEFNVATPTDTAKSRRVSFSRRTGVAEFVKNEATTTWKNFYEEHNKSLESSSNDSEANASRQPVGHLGKRIIDQQFEEVEAVDFISGLANGSLNNVNFSQQLASLECTEEGQLTAPHHKFELSAFTEQSKLFGNDFTAPQIGENSGRIDVNFSAIQQVEKDDLDDIKKDFERGSNNVGCHGPFRDGQDTSEYIEFDLNMTNVVKYNEDMSITDTVHSPVHDVSKSVSIEKKLTFENDWVADKENIAINPYAAPCESNFTVNEEPDQVLVFDGKQLTLQPDIPEKDQKYRPTLLPNSPAETPQRKTMVFNVNDDLPNFVDDLLNFKCENSGFNGFQEIKKEDEISDTITDVKPKRKTILDTTGNVSMTQALPTNIICQTAVISNDVKATNKTIVCNESSSKKVTETVPVKLLSSSRTMPERRRTLPYEDDAMDISITQAVPSNILVNEDLETDNKQKTIVFDSDEDNISVTQAISSNIFEEAGRRKTIVFDVDGGNVSFTQALPANIMLPDKQTQEKRRTIIYGNETEDISFTQAIPTTVFLNNEPNPERRRTVVCADDTGNISVTQALPSNIIHESVQLDYTKENNEAVIIPKQSLPNTTTAKTNENNEPVKIPKQSLPNTTAAKTKEDNEPVKIPKQSLPNTTAAKTKEDNEPVKIPKQSLPNTTAAKTKEDNEAVKIPKQSLPNTTAAKTNENNEAVKIPKQSVPNTTTAKDSDASRHRTIVYENDTGNISTTQAIPTQLILAYSEEKPFDAFNTSRKPRNRKRTTIVYDNDEGDISMTEAIPANIIEEATNKRKTVIFDDDEANVSPARAISTNVFLLDKLDSAVDCIIKPEDIKEDKDKIIDYKVYEENALNPTGDYWLDDQKSIVFNADDLNSDMSMTMAIPKDRQSLRETEKRKTIIFENESCDDVSMTNPIPVELNSFGTELLEKHKNLTIDVNEPDQANPKSDVIVMQASTPNSKPSLHSTPEQNDLKKPLNINSNVTNESKEALSVDVGDEDVSASASLLHPRLEEKSNQLNLMSCSETNVDKVSEGEGDAIVQTDKEEKNTSDPSLHNMSATSVVSGTEDKNFMARRDSNPSSDNLKQDNTSNESMFYITKDSDDVQPDTEAEKREEEEEKAKPQTLTYNQSAILQLEYKEEPVENDDLQMNQRELQSDVSENNDHSNRFFENVVRSELEDVVEKDDSTKYQEGHNSKNSNETQELLDMISNLTDSRDDNDDEIEPVAIKLKRHSEVTEPKRLSFAPNRQSIALSREDLLNNISMAQAALQKSRLALDDSDCPEEDTRDASADISKTSGRASNEVVKTLQFDDESISDTSLKYETKYSPLKKTVFGESSYMNETKGKVIPTYLKDVSDGIKELMLDLVKPMNDNLPFESIVDKDLTNVPSTQSTQIQANIVTSSQIDLDCELPCNTDTNVDTHKVQSLTSSLNKSRSRALRSPVKFSGISSEMSSESDVPNPEKRYSYSPPDAPEPALPDVLVFDHLNPLNNILLAPINYSGVHSYNPKQSDETLCGIVRRHSTNQLNKSSKDNAFEVETVTTAQFRAATRTMQEDLDTIMQEDVYVYKKQDDQFSLQSTSSSRPISIDPSIHTLSKQLKDDQVNTMIAMKVNRDLLEASSSLTLVDDALDGDGRLSPDNEYENHRIKFSRSNLVDIEELAAEIDNNAISPERAFCEPMESLNSLVNKTKGKKRIYSPAVDKYRQYQHSIELTPKPITKIKKISNSPNLKKVTIERGKVIEVPAISKNESTHKMAPEKDVAETNERSSEQTSDVSEKKSPKAEQTKQGQTITVQQLLTDYHNLDADFKHIPEKQLLADLNLNPKSESFTALSQSDVSFTSSKNLNAMKDVNSTSTTDCQSPHQSSAMMQGMPFQMEWHPELMCEPSSNLYRSDSGVNVVAKIDMLPFMGSHECEWESSSADTWSFRLLHGRLRLTARLAHRLDNSTRTRVRGDTRVLDIAVETVQHDRKNPVATMTVRFACETMRYMVSRSLRSTCYANDVPPLLRRCAAVARVALRWGRAMHDAKLHLAYTLDNEGHLSLKVANIPLRSVWEVTMRIELVLDDNRGVPWPRAGCVRVARVVSDVLVPDTDVRRALAHTPRDWGHAPRSIWRMFRYLKHKTRDDDLLLA